MSIIPSIDEENVTRVTEIKPVPLINTSDTSFQLIDNVLYKTSISHVQMSISEFFKHCFTCKKYIGEMVDIYIYKDMPFCSNSCRNKEMDKDGEEKPKNHAKMNGNRRSRKNYTPGRFISSKK